jgi:DNA-binding NtrC family response regulator
MKLDDGEDFIGSSSQMRSVFEVIQRVGAVNTSVLIRGENGTGKELVARAIHFNSPRKEKPFVAINCGAVPENLVESEFFGHEKGAFTGADQRHIGRFQYAEGGTLFLDEIGDISAAMQVKLLRVLQERKFTPVGSNREIRCDVRIIAATNRNLEELIAQSHFRQDLFYRLNVMPIELPPLRNRLEDIPVLVEHFIEKFNRLHNRTGTDKEMRGIREDALNALKNYRWPGNIRELENIVERAFVLENSLYVTMNSLPDTLQTRSRVAPEGSKTEPQTVIDFHNQKEQFEREFIINALRRFGGRINQTVAHAGIPKNTLLRKIRKYGINPTEYGPVNQDGEENN